MAEIPQPWRAYARLQSNLSRTSAVNDRVWGVEAGLNLLLNAESPAGQAREPELARARNTAARRERSRARWRALRLTPLVQTAFDPEPGLAARRELQAIRSHITREEWRLLCGVAAGNEYAVLASERATTAGALRVTVTRLRTSLRRCLVSSAPSRGHATLALAQ